MNFHDRRGEGTLEIFGRKQKLTRPAVIAMDKLQLRQKLSKL